MCVWRGGGQEGRRDGWRWRECVGDLTIAVKGELLAVKCIDLVNVSNDDMDEIQNEARARAHTHTHTYARHGRNASLFGRLGHTEMHGVHY